MTLPACNAIYHLHGQWLPLFGNDELFTYNATADATPCSIA